MNLYKVNDSVFIVAKDIPHAVALYGAYWSKLLADGAPVSQAEFDRKAEAASAGVTSVERIGTGTDTAGVFDR